MGDRKKRRSDKSSLLDDLDAIEEELDAKKRPFFEAGRTLSQIQDEVHAVREVVVWVPNDLEWPEDLAVLSTYVHDYRRTLNSWDPVPGLATTIDPAVVTGGSAVYTVASTAFEEVYINGLPQTKLAEALGVRSQRENRLEIRGLLEQVSPSLASTFSEAWHSLESSTADPVRGAAYLMRHVLSQTPQVILDRFVGTRPDPDHQSKRIELIADRLARNHVTRLQLRTAARSFRSLYDQLSAAHQAGSLQEAQTKALLYRAQDLLGLLLKSIRLTTDQE